MSGPKRYLAKAVEIVNQGLKVADRRREELTVVAWNPTCVTQTGEDVEQVKRITSFILADMPDSVIELADLDTDEVDPIREDVAAGNIEGAAAKVSDDLLRSIGIFGDGETVCNEMRAFGKLGVDEIVFGPPYGRGWRTAIATVFKTWESS